MCAKLFSRNSALLPLRPAPLLSLPLFRDGFLRKTGTAKIQVKKTFSVNTFGLWVSLQVLMFAGLGFRQSKDLRPKNVVVLTVQEPSPLHPSRPCVPGGGAGEDAGSWFVQGLVSVISSSVF